MAESVGNAYLNVVPKVDKAAAVSAGEGIGGSMGGGLKSIMKGALMGVGMMVANMAVDAAKNLAGEMTKTFTNYMDYQQLSGGAKQIFSEIDYDSIKRDAQEAYKSMGMSANDYLSAINDVGATFKMTMGDQAGYDAAKKGMQAIADYATGTGKDMDTLNEKFMMITRSTGSYQSIADQFSGILPATSADFLEQAQAAGFLSDEYTKLTEVPVAEYQQAVTDMLAKGVDGLGLTENAAREAKQTLSGSLDAMKGAWENFLTAIGDGGKELDLSGAASALVESIKTAFLLVVPEVATIIGTIGQLILDALPDSISGPLAEIGSGIASALQTIGGIARTVLMPVMGALGTAVMSAMGVILPAIQQVVEFVNANVLPTVQGVVAYLMPILTQVLAAVSSNFQSMLGIVQSVMGAIGSIVMTVWPVIQQAIQVAATVIGTVIRAVFPVVQALITGAMNNIRAVASVVWPFIQNAVQVAAGIISSALDGLSGIIGSVESTFNRIKDAITNPIETAKNFISDGVGRIKDIINNAHLRLPDIKVPHFNINGGEIPWGIGGKGYPPSIGIDWYARGGYVEGATLIGAGERGGELIWPSYAPYLDRYAEALASRMDAGGNNVYIDGARVNDDAAIQSAILNLFDVLMRRGAMNVGTV